MRYEIEAWPILYTHAIISKYLKKLTYMLVAVTGSVRIIVGNTFETCSSYDHNATFEAEDADSVH